MTYVARNAGDVKCGDLMIFDSDAGEEKIVKIVGPAPFRTHSFGESGGRQIIRIVGESGREMVLFTDDGVVVAVNER